MIFDSKKKQERLKKISNLRAKCRYAANATSNAFPIDKNYGLTNQVSELAKVLDGILELME